MWWWCFLWTYQPWERDIAPHCPSQLIELCQKQHDFFSVLSTVLHQKSGVGFDSLYKP